MNAQTVDLLIDKTPFRLSGAHPAYLSELAAAHQWGETPLMRMVKALPKGGTFLDVGANIGLTAIAACIARPDIKVIAFEPVPSNADLLEHNVSTNGIGNCTVVRAAAGSDVGSLWMSDNGPWSIIGGRDVQVPVLTLDGYCAKFLEGISIDLIKIDVEGHEPNTLCGARQTIAQWELPIVMEFNCWTLTLAGHNSVVFAEMLWAAFNVESSFGEPLDQAVGFAHDNMVRHGCVEDIILRMRSREALCAITTPAVRNSEQLLKAEINAMQRSTSWRVTAPLRGIKRLIQR